MATIPGEMLLIKLWETLAEHGIGSLLKPWQMRREVKAEVDNMLLLAQAEQLANEIKEGKKQIVLDSKVRLIDSPEPIASDCQTEKVLSPEILRIVSSLQTDMVQEQLRKNVNISKAILHAERLLENATGNPSENEIDVDWILAWQNHAGRSSKEYFQKLWGKILSGELKSPGQYSLRTLEFLKTLSPGDAEFITRNFSFVIDNRILHDDKLLAKYNFTIDTRLRLQQLGLISGAESTLSITYGSEPVRSYYLISFKRAIKLIPKTPGAKVQFYQCVLTTLGKEIITLAEVEANNEYLESISLYAHNNNFTVMIYDYDTVTHQLRNGVPFTP